MKKKSPGLSTAGAERPVHLAAMESEIFAKCHELVKHCSITRYDDGDARKPGWITIKTMGSAWVVTVKDPDAALSMSATGQSLDDALQLADLLLGSDEAPWEPDQWLRKEKGKVNKG